MTLPQLFSALIGGGILLGGASVFIQERTRRFKALFWMAIGMALVLAAFRPQVIEYLGEDSVELRLRLIVALLSFIVLTVTLEAIRVGRMLERYAFLWLVTGLLLLLGAMFEGLATIIPRLTGISFFATVLLILFGFVLLLLFYVSVSLSMLQRRLAQIARELALVEERLRRVTGTE